MIGSANLDFTVRVAALPRPGETVLGGDYVTTPGGKGANQAVAAARVGGRVAFHGALGHDAFGEVLLDRLKAEGVDTSPVRRVAAPTGAAFIGVAEDGENAITVASGANAHLTPDLAPPLTGVTTLVASLEVPLATVMALARTAHDAGGRVVVNAAPARVLPQDLLRAMDVLIVNEGELRAVGGEGEVEEVSRRLLGRGPRVVVVTLGARGCLACDARRTITLPAAEVEVTDTVGAGDTFVGVLAAWLDASGPMGAVEDDDVLPDALRAATAAAALACTRPGAQEAMPTRAELLHFQQTRPPV